jgi:hypothetical protein
MEIFNTTEPYTNFDILSLYYPSMCGGKPCVAACRQCSHYNKVNHSREAWIISG